MILKELGPFEGSEPFEIAGRRAEERMSYYLKRNFADSTGVHVINDFRFEHNGEYAQIDHLIVHRRGMMVIESKSVTSQVRINGHEEWSRFWDGAWKGIPSPIQQANLQRDLLWGVLDASNKQLLGKQIGLIQKGFGGYRYDVFVAISDSGIVERPSDKAYPNVCKADQVCDKILRTILNYQRQTSSAGLLNSMFNPLHWGHRDQRAMFEFSKTEFERVPQYLLSIHRPDSSPRTPELAPISSPLPGNRLPDPTPESTAICQDCKAGLSHRVMDYCRLHPTRFAGQLMCMNCQKKY